MSSKFSDAEIGDMKQTLKDKTMQQELNNRYGRDRYLDLNKAIESLNIESKVAKSFYYFLIGKSNILPSVDTIVSLYKRSKDSLLSMGYGVTLSKLFEITCVTVVEGKGERIDLFNLDGYKAFYDGKSYKVINTNKEPLFDKERVKVILDYLKKCHENVLGLESEKEVSLK